MLRQLVIPRQTQVVIHLPEEYLHQEVEIIVFRVNEAQAETAISEPTGKMDLALFRPYRGRYDGRFNRDELYGRPCLA